MDMSNPPLAIVTGAAHRLGRILALSLARQGFAILLHYHASKSEADETARAIGELGAPVFPFRADLARSEQIEKLFAFTDGLSHPLRVLVNSAANMPELDLMNCSAADWDALFALNLRAPFLVSKAAAERMRAGSLIVNITDAGAQRAWKIHAPYAVSKAGLEALTRIQARTYAPRIRVNAIAPALFMPSRGMDEEEWKKRVGRLPMQRAVSDEDVYAAVEFLLRNDSITGQTILLDGGYSLT